MSRQPDRTELPPEAVIDATLEQAARDVYRRRLRSGLWQSLEVTIGLLAAVALALAAALVGEAIDGTTAWVVLLLALAMGVPGALLGGLGVATWYRTDRLELARELDARMGLDSGLVTALATGTGSPLQQAFLRVVRERTGERLAAAPMLPELGPAAGRWRWGGAALLLLVLSLVVLVSHRDFREAVEQAIAPSGTGNEPEDQNVSANAPDPPAPGDTPGNNDNTDADADANSGTNDEQNQNASDNGNGDQDNANDTDGNGNGDGDTGQNGNAEDNGDGAANNGNGADDPQPGNGNEPTNADSNSDSNEPDNGTESDTPTGPDDPPPGTDPDDGTPPDRPPDPDDWELDPQQVRLSPEDGERDPGTIDVYTADPDGEAGAREIPLADLLPRLEAAPGAGRLRDAMSDADRRLVRNYTELLRQLASRSR